MTLCSETFSYNIWHLTLPLYPQNKTKYNLVVWCLRYILWFGKDLQCIKIIKKKQNPKPDAIDTLYQDCSSFEPKLCMFLRKFNKTL